MYDISGRDDMNSYYDKVERAKIYERQDVKGQIMCGNSWYVGDHSEQLDRPGTRFVIQRRWKRFGDIVLDYLKSRFLNNGSGSLHYLDAGCGDGVNLRWAADFFQEHDINIGITALDYNPLRISRALEKQLVKDAHVASLQDAPFTDSMFDIVLCNHVLEHIDLYSKALSEIFRILKPGGLLIVGVPNEGCFLARLRNNVLQKSILKNTDHVNFFRSETIINALRNTGFNIVRTYCEGFFLPHFRAHSTLTRFESGSRLLSVLGRIFPGQSAEIIVYATKPSGEISPGNKI